MSGLTPRLRATGRAVAAVVFLATWSLASALARPFFARSRAEAWRRGYLGRSCRGLLFILGVRTECIGEPAREPGFLVTNHLGYLDILVLAAHTDSVFVSRADVEHWPALGRLTRWSGTIYLQRERRSDLVGVVRTMQDWLERGVQVVFFPEGTSGRGDAILPIRSSLFEAAVRTTAPVRCATLHYRTMDGDPPADEAVSWWGDAEFMPHLWAMLQLRRIDARLEFVQEAVRSDDRKAVASRVRELLEEHFVPTAPGATQGGEAIESVQVQR